MESNALKEIQMKDEGELNYLLGMQITRDRPKGLLYLHSEKFLYDVLSKANMENCYAAETPLPPGAIFTKRDCPHEDDTQEKERMKKHPHQEIVGQLLYVACTTRPDIA